MSAPIIAPSSPNTENQIGVNDMAANLKVLPHRNINDKSLLSKLHEGFIMTVNKANSPSVTISPAVIGLIFTIIIQTCVGVWWAASLSKEVENKDVQIKELKSDVTTMKVYIDTNREKQVKLEAQIEGLSKDLQKIDLLLQMKGK